MVRKGTFVRIPAQTMHDFSNRRSRPARLLNIFIPGGFEQQMPDIVLWFEKCDQAEQHYQAHVEFITMLEVAGSVLLGGSFEIPLDGAEGAHLLCASNRADAEELAGRAPLVSAGAFTSEIVGWHLVGVCRKAIDPSFSEGA